MLRSLTTAVSGLRAHQTMLDVTGNNIANVNTIGFKASRAIFESTLSEMLQDPSAGGNGNGGTNPSQVGLGTRVAAVSTDLSQGATQVTSRDLDMMIDGDGYFIVRSGGEQLYTRNGAFGLDGNGNLVTSTGAIVQGWAAVNGRVDTNGAIGGLSLPLSATRPASQTTSAVVSGNVPSDGTETLVRTIDVYDAVGKASTLTLTFTPTVDASGANTGWTVSANGLPAEDLTFDADTGALTGPQTLTAGAITVDLSQLTGFAKLSTAEISSQNGMAAGRLTSFSLHSDGSLVGVFSNGEEQAVGQLALASFGNAGGLEDAGSSMMRASANSGAAQIGVADTGSRGSLTGRALEGSNVDLSQEFTNMIIAQRGFQANSRVVTTSDQVLEELVNLVR
jgi:flagellar hook protein FlgE